MVWIRTTAASYITVISINLVHREIKELLVSKNTDWYCIGTVQKKLSDLTIYCINLNNEIVVTIPEELFIQIDGRAENADKTFYQY